MPDRRAMLRGLVALPAGAAIEVGPACVDAVVAAHRASLAARARFDAIEAGASAAHEEALWAAVMEAERRGIAARATTIGGAVTSLEWAEAEFRQWKDEGSSGDRLVLALLASALGVLHRLNA